MEKYSLVLFLAKMFHSFTEKSSENGILLLKILQLESIICDFVI